MGKVVSGLFGGKKEPDPVALPEPPKVEPEAPPATQDTGAGDEARKRLRKKSGFAQTFKVKGDLEPFLNGKTQLG